MSGHWEHGFTQAQLLALYTGGELTEPILSTLSWRAIQRCLVLIKYVVKLRLVVDSTLELVLK